MEHRSDVDGLRAIAIGSILLYHAANLPRFGFLGVDVFFVISGYLITAIIAPKMIAGNFSLLDFYRRRVVRILPALLTMIAVVCAIGCFVLFPFELRGLAHSASWAAGFASNFYFLRHTAYFGALDINPLLHTWSLGVEEQFYILYPLFLFVVTRWMPRYLRLALWAVVLGSAALAGLVVIDHKVAAFYLLPMRGWELAMGGLVALDAVPRLTNPQARQWVSGGALAVVLLALVFMPGFLSAKPVPAAVPICVATALVIAYGGGETIGARLLSLAPMQWLGRISYSLYLWHWPVIEYYRVEVGRPLRLSEQAAVIAVGVIAALVSYWLVEQPIRKRFKQQGRPGRIVAIGVAASLMVGVGAVALAANAERIRPLPPAVARVAAFADYSLSPEFTYQFGPIACHGGTIHFDVDVCLRTDPAKRNVIVLGDSHAAHLWRAITELYPQDNVMQANSTDCRPLAGAGGARLCREMFDRTMAKIAEPGKVQTVILSAQWLPYEIDKLADTIRAIRASGAQVIVIGPSVRYRIDLPLLLARSMLHGDSGPVDAARAQFVPRLDRRMRAIAEAGGARYYSLYDQECPSGKCRVLTRRGSPIHFDQGHFTMDGARETIANLGPI